MCILASSPLVLSCRNISHYLNMQRLSSLFFVLFAFASLFSTPCVRAQGSDVIEKDIASLSVATNDVQILCADINFFNVPVSGPKVSLELGNIAISITSLTSQIVLDHSKPFDDSIALRIVNLLNKFLSVFDRLCVTLISKHKFLASFKVGIRHSLLKIEADLDKLLKALVKIIPTRKKDCNRIRHRLELSIKRVTAVYV